jgi:flagellar FliL protein
MSDESAKPAVSSGGAGAKTSKLVLALLVLNLGASGFGVFKLTTAEPGAAAAPAAPPPPPPVITSEVVGPVVALDPFVVNLDEPGQSRYVKVTFQLELVTKESEDTLTKSKQLVRDTILSHLSGLHLADTLGAAAKDKIRGDITAKLEKLLGPNKVRRMFYQEFVVQ